jgi:GNAT superfamily N-acetyltransferase
MNRAERWARSQGLKSVYLRSNVAREKAHSFYQRLGYRIIKTQHAFQKKL